MKEEKNAAAAAASPNETLGLSQNSLLMGMVALMVLVAGYNQYQIGMLYSLPVAKEIVVVQAAASGSASQAATAQGTQVSATAPGALAAPSDIIPAGVPAVYGTELGIKYEDISSSNPNVQASIDKLTNVLGGDPGNVLKGADLQRYVKLGSMIACEYCCGATTLVFSNGQPACGCAHSYAMRGVLGYLVKNHPELTDDQILEEIGKWKVLFFPGPEQQKATALEQQGIPLNYINLASNKYRDIEQGAPVSGGSTSQVGGC